MEGYIPCGGTEGRAVTARLTARVGALRPLGLLICSGQWSTCHLWGLKTPCPELYVGLILDVWVTTTSRGRVA